MVDDFDGFRQAKERLRLAEVQRQRAWLAAQGGGEAARRRYRTALLMYERAHASLRSVRVLPK